MSLVLVYMDVNNEENNISFTSFTVIMDNDYAGSQRTTSWDVPYTFSGKEKDSETGYLPIAIRIGARYYDSDLSVWLSVDPLSDMYSSTSPYMYVRGNPVMLVDPNGMWDDDFYFRKDGTLIKYVENNQPDRVFVATGETKVDQNDPDLVPEPVYKQTNMSSKEVEKKMKNNGYKVVLKKEVVIQDEVHTYTSNSNGTETENVSITFIETLNQKYSYVKKDLELVKINSRQIKNLKRVRTTWAITERNRVEKTYSYGNKKDNTQRNEGIIIFILSLISQLL